jgi:hypothetical protein
VCVCVCLWFHPITEPNTFSDKYIEGNYQKRDLERLHYEQNPLTKRAQHLLLLYRALGLVSMSLKSLNYSQLLTGYDVLTAVTMKSVVCRLWCSLIRRQFAVSAFLKNVTSVFRLEASKESGRGAQLLLYPENGESDDGYVIIASRFPRSRGTHAGFAAPWPHCTNHRHTQTSISSYGRHCAD